MRRAERRGSVNNTVSVMLKKDGAERFVRLEREEPVRRSNRGWLQ